MRAAILFSIWSLAIPAISLTVDLGDKLPAPDNLKLKACKPSTPCIDGICHPRRKCVAEKGKPSGGSGGICVADPKGPTCYATNERCIDVSDCCAGNNACSPSSSGGQNVCQQVVEDPCDVTYTASGNGVGNGVIPAPEPANGRDCCLLCRDTPNCVASAFPSGCQLLVKLEPLDGAPTSLMCPLGKENYDFLPGPGSVYRGPCSLP